ncbi:MAG: HAMP domain-containing histidine kinase [Coprococcus sp.]|nr:HAMP domain-containing histidine kinase [Coprococcus sp.]
MKKKLLFVTILFAMLVFGISGIFYCSEMTADSDDSKGKQIVAVNELLQLAADGDMDAMQVRADELQAELRTADRQSTGAYKLLWLGGVAVLFIVTISLYLYLAVLYPFDRMSEYAERLAQGNFNIPLRYERSNYFGEFTWAFDNMRREITKARAGEKEAVENNKTVIATLSHDIKTPIASIRAYAEGLEAHLDSSPEKRAKYLNVIMKKCDEVSKLTNDLFLHSLSDLDKLKMETERVELCCFMEQLVSELDADKQDIHYEKPDFKAECMIDKNRFTQLVENIVNNARKYAKTDIDIGLTKQERQVTLSFRDYGTGIPDSDMPFICGKFYRGKNAGNEQGSGLGLYIVKYIADKLGGELLLENHANGLEIFLKLPVS